MPFKQVTWLTLTRRTELSISGLRGDSSMRRWRRMCFRALCTMLETDSLEMGTVAAGSVSLDKAELISLFSTDDKHIQEFLFNCWGGPQMPRSPSKLRTFPECSMVTQQVKPGTWPLPSSSAYPLPGISSVDSVLQQSLKSSVTASPTGNENSYWPDIFLFKLFMKHTLQHSEAGQHLCNIF